MAKIPQQPQQLDLFKHQLNLDFQTHYEMGKAEAEYFSEAWSHYHRVMTEVNEQWTQNTIWLNENFNKLWNDNTPQDLLKICVEHAVETLAKTSMSQHINTSDIPNKSN